jgi:murein DD-endopeptidase MepM/ murein hydrolase activator NlpD
VGKGNSYKKQLIRCRRLCSFSLEEMLANENRATVCLHAHSNVVLKKCERKGRYSHDALANLQFESSYEGKAILGVLNRWAPLIPEATDHSGNNRDPKDFATVVSTFKEPMRSAVVTRGLGRTRKGTFHAGTDFAAPVGTPVFPIAKGRVIFAGKLPVFRQYGSIVVVNHGAGIYVLYGHVKPVRALQPKTKPKDGLNYTPVDVNHDTVIARIASPTSGESSTGPHLHLEMIVVDREAGQPHFTLHSVLRYFPKSRKFKYFALSEEMGRQDPYWVTCALGSRKTLPAPPLAGLRSILEIFGYPTDPGLASMVSNLF